MRYLIVEIKEMKRLSKRIRQNYLPLETGNNLVHDGLDMDIFISRNRESPPLYIFKSK